MCAESIYMDNYGNPHFQTMLEQTKQGFYNIYINPSFHGPKKSVIHINPKVQLNVPVHVNPKMVNALSTSGAQRERLLAQEKQAILDQLPKPSVQNSVYVNPKLMQKLTSKTTKNVSVPEIVNKQQATPQLPTVQKPITILKTKMKIVNNNTNNSSTKPLSVKKTSPSKIVLLSNRKLIRIRGATKKVLSPPPVNRKIKPHQVININEPKPFVSINKKVVVENKIKNVGNRIVVPSTSSANKYKLDRTKVQKKKVNIVRVSKGKIVERRNTNLIKIDGVLYKSSKSQLVKSSSNGQSSEAGIKKSLNTSRTKNVYKKVKSDSKIAKVKNSSSKLNLSRVSITSFAQKSNYKHVLSNRVKQKSIQILRQKMSKNNQPCLLYQRFGYCAKFVEGTCPKVHDKKQIALCKNFLQGKCLLDKCPLSHEVGPEKMPTCKYFLDGCCVRDSCQYLHVKVAANTPICIAFLRGYCEKGTECSERHTNICPEYEKTGKCLKGKNCPYPHKSFLLAKQKSCKKLKTSTFNKQTKNSEKPDAPFSRDESKKRYYDDNNLDKNLSIKRTNILNRIHAMKSLHLASEQNLVIAQDSSDISNNLHQQQPDKSSQPDSQNVLLRRPPIGPLPAYIPIE